MVIQANGKNDARPTEQTKNNLYNTKRRSEREKTSREPKIIIINMLGVLKKDSFIVLSKILFYVHRWA